MKRRKFRLPGDPQTILRTTRTLLHYFQAASLPKHKQAQHRTTGANIMNYGLKELLSAEGLTEDEFLEEYAHDSVCPGICTTCGAVYEYEPDSVEGWCEECETNTVKSGLILMEVI